jgi:hypothetical protein
VGCTRGFSKTSGQTKEAPKSLHILVLLSHP